MKRNLAGLLVFSFLYLATLEGNTEGFFHKREQRPAAGQDLFKKLKIQRFSEKVPAPDFTLADLNGNRVRLQDLRGQVVFLNFWATWCPPCVREMPTMEKLHQELGVKGLVILAVNFREGPEQIRAFLKKHKLTFTTILDPRGKVFELYQAWSLPTTTIVNKRGEIAGKAIGYKDWHKPEAKGFFRELIEKKQ